MKINAIILAHKQEKAMKSTTPVYLHDLLDKTMIDYAIEALQAYSTTIIIDRKDNEAFAKYKDKHQLIAVSSEEDCYTQIAAVAKKDYTLIVNGNTPSINQEHIEKLLVEAETSSESITSLSYNLKPTGVFCIKSECINNKYNTLEQLTDHKKSASVDIIADDQFYPIINRYHLSLVENDLRKEIIKKHMFNGVTIKNMESVTIGPDVKIAPDTIIFPNTYITGKVKIGEACKLGPFLRIRQAATLGNGVKIGNFVELKNATMGNKSASAHLSYLGDTTIGQKVNIGCGVITVNYDGANKHHTTIEDEAFIGCNSNLIAPVTIGSDALVAAGSTVTKNVPAKALCFARARQINKEGYKRPKKK